jgi:hypothetical protein
MRYSDGKLIKGYTSDFFPNKPLFHARPVDAKLTDKVTEVHLKDLKAVFFVKDFDGNPAHDDVKEFSEGQHVAGRKMEVTFPDGEVIVGTTMGFDPQRLGFFITPADPGSNNLRVFVPTASVKKSRFL